jgi:hypothetical protein
LEVAETPNTWMQMQMMMMMMMMMTMQQEDDYLGLLKRSTGQQQC